VSRLTFITLLTVAIILLVGLLVDTTALALIGLFGGVAIVAVQALIAGGDFIQEASKRRFRDNGR
jgi:hypothetical protein